MVLQVVTLLGVVSIAIVETTVASVVTFLGLSPHRVRVFEESFLLDLEEDLSLGRVERNVGELVNAYSALSVLFLGSPSGGPREDLAHGHFWSFHLCPECGYVLYWVRVTIIRLQRREVEVLRDGCILDFLDKERATKGTLTMLVLHPDGLVDIVNSFVH
ncbi:hypothetical protein BHM03_00023215 [Ensete ventricosum]|nr:hypothetical protein BHM03_00023215 [Ensete ventricosum]